MGARGLPRPLGGCGNREYLASLRVAVAGKVAHSCVGSMNKGRGHD